MTAGSGPEPRLSFNATSNQVGANGYTYDAAGNMTNDTSHAYTYDADGNILTVDGGQTATYVYDALNHRVSATVGTNTTEYVFNGVPGDRSSSAGQNVNGERVSEWNAATHAQLQGKFYWGTTPLAYYDTTTHFEHQDWEGTERMRTSDAGNVEAKFTSLPWGDMQGTQTGSDTDAAHYATLDYDGETNTDHAQFRQYNPTQGRFMSPDPYGGSYDAGNPQSMNRYVYAMNNPLGNIDPSGLCTRDDVGDESGGDCYGLDFCDADICQVAWGNSGSGGSATITQMNGGGCNMNDPICQAAFQNMFGNNQLQFPTIMSSGGGGGGGGAPNSGPSYTPEDVCAASALLNKGLPTLLDAIGIIPLEGRVVKATQFVAALFSAGLSTFGESTPTDAALSGTSLGLSGVDNAHVMTSGAEVVPLLGIGVSIYATSRDVHSMGAYYNDCLAGKN